MTTINNAIYNDIAASWWEEDGFMALLRTAINPPRTQYFREILLQRLKLNPAAIQVLDVGCGGGLLAEEFAKLGCRVTGIDRSTPTLMAARVHAEKNQLPIRYLEASAEQIPFSSQQFDVVVCCDVLEHVDDVERVVAEISRVLKPGGLFLFDTINRTFSSKWIAIKLAQECALTRVIPRDVHVWEKFIRPDELKQAMQNNGLVSSEMTGLAPSGNFLRAGYALLKQKLGKISFAELGQNLVLKPSANTSISYMGFAVKVVT